MREWRGLVALGLVVALLCVSGCHRTKPVGTAARSTRYDGIGAVDLFNLVPSLKSMRVTSAAKGTSKNEFTVFATAQAASATATQIRDDLVGRQVAETKDAKGGWTFIVSKPSPYYDKIVLQVTTESRYLMKDEGSAVSVRFFRSPLALPEREQYLEDQPRFHQIKKAIMDRHQFSDEDRRFLIRKVDAPTLTTWAQPLLLLTIAKEAHMFPEKDLLEIIERKAKATEGGDSNLALLNYRHVLALGFPLSSDYTSLTHEVLALKKTANRITPGDKEFITRVLASDDASIRGLAGEVFVQKKGLDTDSTRWVLGLIDLQIRQAQSKNWKSYWAFVRRVTEYKNGKRAL